MAVSAEKKILLVVLDLSEYYDLSTSLEDSSQSVRYYCSKMQFNLTMFLTYAVNFSAMCRSCDHFSQLVSPLS